MLTTRFESSVLKALCKAYPDHEWQPWWFAATSKEHRQPIEEPRKEDQSGGEA